MMDRVTLVGGSCCALAACGCTAQLIGHQAEGIWAIPSRVDHGRLSQGVTVDAAFTLFNNTHQPISIISISESCGCSAVALGKQMLAPGEKLPITMSWQTRNRHGKQAITATIACKLPDGSLDFVDLTVSGFVERDLEPSVDRIVFAGRDNRTFVVTLRANRPCEVLDVYSTHRAFSAELRPDRCSIAVIFDPAEWISNSIEAQLVIETTGHERVLRIPLIVGSDALQH